MMIYLLSLLPITIALGAIGNRQRGKDTADRFLHLPKLVWYVLLGIPEVILLTVVCQQYSPHEPLWLSILLSLWWASFGNFVLLAPSWGELFAHVEKDTSMESPPAGVKTITRWLTGYDHTQQLWMNHEYQRIISWKESAMCVRWSLYSAFKFLGYFILTHNPLVLAGILGMSWCGVIYNYFFAQQRAQGGSGRYDAVKKAEPGVGAYFNLMPALLLLAMTFISIQLW
jgi:hypothetical protein